MTPTTTSTQPIPLTPVTWLASLWNSCLDLIYPPACMGCDTLLPLASTVHPPAVMADGRILPSAKVFLCPNCVDDFAPAARFSPEGHGFAYPYKGLVQQSIYKLKYGKQAHVAQGLGICMAESIGRDFFGDTDMIVPVPIHPKRHRTRGFNQAERLALYLCHHLQLPAVPKPTNALQRVKNTRPMAELSPSLRKHALHDAFCLNKKVDIVNLNVVLVDDIYTTGATLDACAQLMLVNGAKKVRYATLAKVR